MRNYEQIFAGWIKIEIERDARRLKIKEAVLKEHLQALSKRGVLKMYTLKAGPKLTFLQNRLPQKYLDKFVRKYNFLKTLGESRNESVTGLIVSVNCRMQYILNYFGETSAATCGSCDICLPMPLAKKKSLSTQREMNEDPDNYGREDASVDD